MPTLYSYLSLGDECTGGLSFAALPNFPHTPAAHLPSLQDVVIP